MSHDPCYTLHTYPRFHVHVLEFHVLKVFELLLVVLGELGDGVREVEAEGPPHLRDLLQGE